jgi:hypothetical protein
MNFALFRSPSAPGVAQWEWIITIALSISISDWPRKKRTSLLAAGRGTHTIHCFSGQERHRLHYLRCGQERHTLLYGYTQHNVQTSHSMQAFRSLGTYYKLIGEWLVAHFLVRETFCTCTNDFSILGDMSFIGGMTVRISCLLVRETFCTCTNDFSILWDMSWLGWLVAYPALSEKPFCTNGFSILAVGQLIEWLVA